MKKIITICLLVVTLLLGGMTMEAKTTKKKAKAKTASTSSAKWNGDIPPASFIANTFFFGSRFPNNENILKNHGYTMVKEYGGIVNASKEGVCEIGFQSWAHSMEVSITVYNTTQREWLYNSIRSFLKSEGRHSGYEAVLDGNSIYFSLSRWSH